MSLHIPFGYQAFLAPVVQQFQVSHSSEISWVGENEAAVYLTSSPDRDPGTEKLLLCADEWIAVSGPNWGGALMSKADLSQARLLASSRQEVDRWTHFLAEADGPAPAKVPVVTPQAKAAALRSGTGIAIARRADVLRQLSSGSLSVVSSYRRWTGQGLYAVVRDSTLDWDRAWALAEVLRSAMMPTDN